VKTGMRSMGLGIIALLGVCGVSGTALAADSSVFVAHDAWVRLPAASRTETAAYMVIENKSTTARSIVSASSPDVSKIELHEMKMSHDGMSGMPKAADKPGGSMMTMMPVARIDIPAKGRATLAPNGLHLMLFGLKSKLVAGSKVSIALKLDDGSTVPVTASVRAPE
jgi:periplasmic copper chaperone A